MYLNMQNIFLRKNKLRWLILIVLVPHNDVLKKSRYVNCLNNVRVSASHTFINDCFFKSTNFTFSLSLDKCELKGKKNK